jgi:predicted ATPase
VYQQLLEQSEVFVGIYWQSYGWVAPDMDVSGIEDEYDRSHGRPQLIYLKVPAPDLDPRLRSLLDRIKESSQVSYKKFTTPEELRELLASDLALLLAERFHSDGDSAPPVMRHVLPSPLTPFIGRERLLASTMDLLQDAGVRLVTLTGTGGVGKTRLALEIGHRVEDTFDDGAAFVDLVALQDPILVPSAILQELGVPEDGAGTQTEQLRNYLAGKELLLVLDNFEHMLDAAADVTDLLARSPRLKVLVTSRAPLRVEGEREFPVGPFDLPQLEPVPTLEDLSGNEAVAFFVQRAQAVRPDFALDTTNARTVATICARLDGLPLAIGLAAARIRTFPDPVALLARLQQRLPLLVGGPRNSPARQRTMRDAIAWSYDLLSSEDQALFRCLGHFRGGASFQAVEAVIQDSVPTDVDALTGLESLIEASLVLVAPGSGGEPRFATLGIIREYAMEQLSLSGELGDVQVAFIDYFINLTEGLAETNRGIPTQEWMDRLQVEIDNLRSALELADEQDDPAALIALASNLWGFWNVRGYLTEGRSWLERALLRAEEAEAPVRADMVAGAAQLARRQRDYHRAEVLLRSLRDGHHEQGETKSEVHDLLELASLEYDQSNYMEATALFEEAETLSRENNYELGMLLAQAGRGGVETDLQRYDRARTLLEPACWALRKLGPNGDEAALGSCLMNLGRVAQAEKNWVEAISLTDECLEVKQRTGDTRGRPSTLLSLARMVQESGDTKRAEKLRQECLSLSEQVEDPLYIALSRLEMGRFDASRSAHERASLLRASLKELVPLGELRAVAENLEALAVVQLKEAPVSAATMYSAADALRTRISFPLWEEGDIKHRDQRIAFLRAVLGAAQFGEAWKTGQTQTVEEIIKKVLEDS